MKRHHAIALAAAALVGSLGAAAGPAFAMPSQSSTCTGCHAAGGGVTVAVKQVSNTGGNATYSVAIAPTSGRDGWAVFSGSTKVASGTSATGQFTVADGKSYTVYGVSNGGNSASTVVSPVAPAPAPTPAPTPAPAPAPTPAPTPAPAPAPAPAPTPAPTPAPAPAPAPTPAPAPAPAPSGSFTVRLHVGDDVEGTVVLTNVATNATISGTVSDGVATFTNVPAGTYRLNAGDENGRIVRVGTHGHRGHHGHGRHADRRGDR